MIKNGSWPVLPVFSWMQKFGNVADAEMDRVFNMGVGFCVVCSPHFADSIVKQLGDDGLEAWKIGTIESGEAGVIF